MGDIEVRGAGLRTAGDRLRAAVDTATAAEHPAEVRRVDAALPGSTSGPAAQQCADAWARTRDAWVHDATHHADALVASADAYDRSDAAAARAAWGLAGGS